ncbi:hypothetical protein PspLS_11758 [Pyricularia sp. CBS 133598]|nr:hypothetical protein PspLS_11758 [Pyricularia sp. CBS 133598]
MPHIAGVLSALDQSRPSIKILAVAAVGASAIIILQFIWFLVNQVRSPLRRIPGPLLARFSPAWYAWKVGQGSFPEVNVDLHQKYETGVGKIVRYSPNHYSINDPHAVKIIYGFGGKQFAKSDWYGAWSEPQPEKWNLFGDRSVSRHAECRKQYQAAYSMSALTRYEPMVDDCVSIFAQRLRELASTNTAIDMRHWLQCYAFDVIGQITFSERFGFLDKGQDVGDVIQNLESLLAFATFGGIFPSVNRAIFAIMNMFPSLMKDPTAYIMNFTAKKIQQARADPKAVPRSKDARMSQDFVQTFMAKQEANPDVFTPYHIQTGCMSNVVAGSDTTAISLSAVMYYLLKHPAAMQALRNEVDQFDNQGRLSQVPTFAESQQMPYLQAVFKEALRLHPATGLPLERVVPEGGAEISGRFFPEGSIVGINTWVAHRDKTIFGDDADSFRPERWIEGDPARIAEMNRYWMPFGLGTRTCIGRHISILEMSKLIPFLVRDFDFSLERSLISRDWQVTWIANLIEIGLEELYLDGCPVLWHASTFVPTDADGFPTPELMCYGDASKERRVTPLRWHHILPQWCEAAEKRVISSTAGGGGYSPSLRVFMMGTVVWHSEYRYDQRFSYQGKVGGVPQSGDFGYDTAAWDEQALSEPFATLGLKRLAEEAGLGLGVSIASPE